jgi:hypothetical protein
MVPPPASPTDYEFVILLFGARRLRRSEFSPWSADRRPRRQIPLPLHKERTMKTASLFASLALVFAAGSALAQEATPDTWTKLDATQSRAQVQADLAQARADGSLKVLSLGYHDTVKAAGKTRADVAAETRAALRDGGIARANAEAWGFEPRLPGAAGTRLAQAAR